MSFSVDVCLSFYGFCVEKATLTKTKKHTMSFIEKEQKQPSRATHQSHELLSPVSADVSTNDHAAALTMDLAGG